VNRNVLSGVFILAIALSVVGAATTASSSPSTASEQTSAEVIGSEQESTEAVEEADTNVPIRSGDIETLAQNPTQAVPVEVRIAEIGLAAPIMSVGVDEQNQFDVPEADTVGWYQYSSSPGDDGATVLAAHVDYGGVAGAFFNLADVLPGETLELEMDDGSVLRYKVTGNTEYDKTELPANDLFRKDGSPVLQLITCGGTFNPDERSYNANVVVTAEPI